MRCAPPERGYPRALEWAELLVEKLETFLTESHCARVVPSVLQRSADTIGSYERPAADAALIAIMDLFAAAQHGRLNEVAAGWAARADEATVRGMIKLASTLASARGQTDLRLSTADGAERLVRLSAEKAPSAGHRARR